ncbi:MAG: ATP-binding cassette domain-containing protein, partial [Clostridia bacterium]|nr:ATP-binding cassette domain-containing protein [Clostridia bacterium]
MGSYQIKNVSFAYPNRECDALKNINLSINSGEFVTLCGKSGCGKTTFLRF